MTGLAGTDLFKHVRNFLDRVKFREMPVCNSTVARCGHLTCFAAAISWKLVRRSLSIRSKEELGE